MEKRVIPQMDKKHYATFNISGFQYYQGCEVFNDLKVGTKLELAIDRENKFDPEAVAILFGNYLLGYVPRCFNHDIYTMLDMGVDDIFEVRICRVQPEAHPERQIDVSVFVKKQY